MLLYTLIAGPILIFRMFKISDWLSCRKASPSILCSRKAISSTLQPGMEDTKSMTSRRVQLAGSTASESLTIKSLRNWECFLQDSSSAGRILADSINDKALSSEDSIEPFWLLGAMRLLYCLLGRFSEGSSLWSLRALFSSFNHFGGRPSFGLLQPLYK